MNIYVSSFVQDVNLSSWVSQEGEGSIRYPGDFTRRKYYTNGENVTFTISVPTPSARLVLHVESMDVEFQRDCLYDFLQFRDTSSLVPTKICGKMTSTE
jgi:hypothetical protein